MRRLNRTGVALTAAAALLATAAAAQPAEPPEKDPAAIAALEDVAATIQERAWISPIWVKP